ncbi:hypothetical protein PTKIN_Ptkin15bG0136500 [Pterospermum kingtungense]
MASYSVPSWTLIGLIRAFLDLALAYFLLCGSTLGFFVWKFYHVFGLYLPCPCSGFFGYQNSNLCWHKLLIQWPRTKIYSVQKLVFNRFPFNLLLSNLQDLSSNAKFITDEKLGYGVIELETPSGLRLQTMVDNKESVYDAKGKKITNQKQKSGIRRRRRAAFGYGKSSPVLLSDDKNTQTGNNVGEGTWHGFELSNEEEICSTSVRKSTCNTNEKLGITGDEANRIRMLEQALEEEKAAHAGLYLELEKERAAAASATDEAMAMILRLQEDKASIEMETRQYQRMIEEKFAYDEEEMSILKEILVRREKENHLLEKEVEAYRQMNSLGDEQEDCNLSYTLSEGGQRPSVSLGFDEDPVLMVNQMETSGSTGKKEEENCSSWPSKNETSSAEKQSDTAAFVDVEPVIYDVHVVDDKIDIPKEEHRKGSKLPASSASDHKTLLYDSGNSSSAVSYERLEIDAEIEHLREKLKIVRGGKEKLAFPADQRERVDLQLKLIEELVNQLRQFQLTKEPVRQSSLPPLSSSSK